MMSHYYIHDPGSVIRHLDVPEEIVRYCDHFTHYADRDDLRHIDCVYMHMGEYGNDPEQLKQLRQIPVFN